MESRHGAHKASKFAAEDFISNMPDIVITNILDRLPLQDAVGTSVLSRNWRFKWTTLSQLIFDEKFYDYLTESKQDENYERIISRLLLNLKDGITKFVLYIEDELLNDEDIAHWMLFLSRKGVKGLVISKMQGALLDLPTHLYSCLDLKHLKLHGCRFDPPASFIGFPNLLSLKLGHVEFDDKKFGALFTQCPVLERLDLGFTYCKGMVKHPVIKDSSSIFKFAGIFPKLQELNMNLQDFKFTKDCARKRCSTTFPCLKKLKIKNIDMRGGIMLSFAFDIIRNSLDLQTLEITSSIWDNDPLSAACFSEVDYNTMGMLQLQSVVFMYSDCSVNEVCLIKYLLARSPFLKKVVIRPSSMVGSDEKLKFAMKLLELHRASPVAEIKLLHY